MRVAFPFSVASASMYDLRLAVVAGFLLTGMIVGWIGSARATAAADYRLAGVIVAGDDYIGLLELPNGEQMLVRLNQCVPNGGRVVAIDDQRVHIAFPAGTLEFAIDDAANEVASTAAGAVPGRHDQGHVHVRSVEPGLLKQELATAGSVPAIGREATQRRGRKDAAAEVGQRFARVADLSPNARVLAVNERPVSTADSATAEVNRTLASGMPARLTLANDGDVPHRVYLLPAPR